LHGFYEGLKKMTDLGCMNGWASRIVYTSYEDMVNKTNGKVEKPDTTPIEYVHCQEELHHSLAVGKKGNCWYQYTCPICGITWDVDSSD
jgi:hypothetical protein